SRAASPSIEMVYTAWARNGLLYLAYPGGIASVFSRPLAAGAHPIHPDHGRSDAGATAPLEKAQNLDPGVAGAARPRRRRRDVQRQRHGTTAARDHRAAARAAGPSSPSAAAGGRRAGARRWAAPRRDAAA